ncbi:MAG: M15 family metallopeptidase [Actinobacteria bacterium]|nr:M15 family metallopeptidase [Actinomycetota bacterium]
MTKIVRHVVSALAGVAIAAATVLGAAALEGEPPAEPPPVSGAAVPSEAERNIDYAPARPRQNRILLAWVPTGTGGLPRATEHLLKKTKGVNAVTVAAASLDWLLRSTGGGGGQVDAPPAGMKIPVEVVAIDPAEYEAFVPPSDRAAVVDLGRGEVLLSETGAELRGYSNDMTVVLESGEYTVAGVVSDAAANGYEMLVAAPPPPTWQIVDRFALIHSRANATRARVARTLKAGLGRGQVLRLRAKGETPYLRYGDAVMPQAVIKANFGEFAARPLPDGTVVIDPRWIDQNIVTERVPILGEITCHRALFPQLRQALVEVRHSNLSFVIDRSQFGGCYGPRFIGRVAGGRLSHHAWGIAIDINAADNAFGTRSDLDPRLVEIMERFGFTWGGRWLVPDGMHFEWVRFP